MWLIVLAKWLSVVTRFQSGCFTNTISWKKRLSIGEVIDEGYLSSRIADIESEASRQVKKNMLSECIGCCKVQILAWLDGLSLFGVLQLMILVSFPYMVQALEQTRKTKLVSGILTTISRSPGNAVPIVAQKSLLGHSKGGSAAWQMAGLLQSVITRIIPPNMTLPLFYGPTPSANSNYLLKVPFYSLEWRPFTQVNLNTRSNG